MQKSLNDWQCIKNYTLVLERKERLYSSSFKNIVLNHHCKLIGNSFILLTWIQPGIKIKIMDIGISRKSSW